MTVKAETGRLISLLL